MQAFGYLTFLLFASNLFDLILNHRWQALPQQGHFGNALFKVSIFVISKFFISFG
jgi:hypothetical protein